MKKEKKKKKNPKCVCTIFQWNFLLPFGIFTMVLLQNILNHIFFSIKSSAITQSIKITTHVLVLKL